MSDVKLTDDLVEAAGQILGLWMKKEEMPFAVLAVDNNIIHIGKPGETLELLMNVRTPAERRNLSRELIGDLQQYWDSIQSYDRYEVGETVWSTRDDKLESRVLEEGDEALGDDAYTGDIYDTEQEARTVLQDYLNTQISYHEDEARELKAKLKAL